MTLGHPTCVRKHDPSLEFTFEPLDYPIYVLIILWRIVFVPLHLTPTTQNSFVEFLLDSVRTFCRSESNVFLDSLLRSLLSVCDHTSVSRAPNCYGIDDWLSWSSDASTQSGSKQWRDDLLRHTRVTWCGGPCAHVSCVWSSPEWCSSSSGDVSLSPVVEVSSGRHDLKPFCFKMFHPPPRVLRSLFHTLPCPRVLRSILHGRYDKTCASTRHRTVLFDPVHTPVHTPRSHGVFATTRDRTCVSTVDGPQNKTKEKFSIRTVLTPITLFFPSSVPELRH